MMKVTVDTCPACDGGEFFEVVALSDTKKYCEYSLKKYDSYIDDWMDELDIAIDACPICDHHRYRDQPNEEMLYKMYDKGRPLFPERQLKAKKPSKKIIKEVKRVRKILKQKSPTFLDYGSGFGIWARAAVNEGFEVTAYEPSKERASENNKIDFKLVHDLSELSDQTFDLINLEQVLEHIPNPCELLNSLHAFCNPGTIIRITVPNILRSGDMVNIWNDWPYNGKSAHIMAPFEHLHGFTPKSLKMTSERAGFTNANNFRVWLTYPIEILRNYIGELFPKYGQTFILLKIKN